MTVLIFSALKFLLNILQYLSDFLYLLKFLDHDAWVMNNRNDSQNKNHQIDHGFAHHISRCFFWIGSAEKMFHTLIKKIK